MTRSTEMQVNNSSLSVRQEQASVEEKGDNNRTLEKGGLKGAKVNEEIQFLVLKSPTVTLLTNIWNFLTNKF